LDGPSVAVGNDASDSGGVAFAVFSMKGKLGDTTSFAPSKASSDESDVIDSSSSSSSG